MYPLYRWTHIIPQVCPVIVINLSALVVIRLNTVSTKCWKRHIKLQIVSIIQILDQKVLGSNSARDRIQFMTLPHFIALSPLHLHVTARLIKLQIRGSIWNTVYMYFSYFTTKTYVVGTHLKCLIEALQMSTNNICCRGESRKTSIIFGGERALSGALTQKCFGFEVIYCIYYCFIISLSVISTYPKCRPHCLGWMRRPTGDQEVAGSTPAKVGNILSWWFDHEIFSTVILSLPLIQEGQMSVSGERMCTILVNRLED